MYLADKLPLSAHEGDTVLHRQVQSSLNGLLQGEIKVKPTKRNRKVGQLLSSQCLQCLICLSYLSLNSGLRSLFLVAVLLLVVAFLSGSRMNEMYGSAPSLEQAARALWV